MPNDLVSPGEIDLIERHLAELIQLFFARAGDSDNLTELDRWR